MSTMKQFLNKHPIVKGMLAYSITWPTGNIIQQTMAGKRWGKLFFVFIRITFFSIHTCMNQLLFPHKNYIIFFFHPNFFVIKQTHRHV